MSGFLDDESTDSTDGESDGTNLPRRRIKDLWKSTHSVL